MKKCKVCNNKIPESRIYCCNKCKFSDKDYNIKRGKRKVKNDKTKLLKCKICNWTTHDIKNFSGVISKHMLNIHNIKIINNNFGEYFNVIDYIEPKTINCPYCNWSTIDIENKSGWFTTHLKKEHNLSISSFLNMHPEYKNLWKQYNILKSREQFLNESKDNYVKCKICGQKLKYITNTHLKTHNISQKEYKKQYGDIVSKYTREVILVNCWSMSLKGKDDYFVSKAEYEIVDFLKESGVKNINHTCRNIIKGKELDIYLPDYNVAIEFNGLYWHSELVSNRYKDYHIDKTNKCEEQGIQLIHIFSDEWEQKQHIVKNRIKSILGLNKQKIYARNCVVKEISNKQKNDFLVKFHIQGKDQSKIKLGAFYNDKLVSVMTFGGLRKPLGSNSREGKYELMRFCVGDISVVGIASKLLHYFIKNYNPIVIITYADKRWTKSNNNLYETIGFKKISNGKPNYWYLSNYSERLYRYGFRKSNLKTKLKTFDTNLTEWENMQNNGYDRIWDCGSLKYELIVKKC